MRSWRVRYEDGMHGRELDRLIATRVMGLVGVSVVDQGWDKDALVYGKPLLAGFREYVPHYSTQIKDAWTIVEELESRSITLSLQKHNYPSGPGKVWHCTFTVLVDPQTRGFNHFRGESTSLAESICIGALRAYEACAKI